MDNIKTYQRRVTGVRLDTGEFVKADYIISNMEVIPTYKYLLHLDTQRLNKLEREFEPASSGYVMHLGVACQYPQLAHHNFFLRKMLISIINKFFMKRYCQMIRPFI